MMHEREYASYAEALRTEAIKRLPVRAACITGINVRRAMQARQERERRWGWLMEMLGI